MQLDGTFLRSKVGRRMFFTLLAAAAVPIAIFGMLRYRELSDYASAQAHRQLSESTKYAALGTLNRLIVARTFLDVLARQGTRRLDGSNPQASSGTLADVAVLAPTGQLSAGSDRLARLWRAGQAANSVDGNPPPGLWWPQAQIASSARSLVVISRVADDGSIWLGEVDEKYLFDSLSADLAGGDICIFDTHGRALSCPGAALNRAREILQGGGASAPGEAAKWSLFLRAEFGVEDWVLVSVNAMDHAAAASESVAKSAVQAALATLLIITLLSLVQVRRTTVPLERLISVTRRLIGRDFSARVTIDRDDEFGELADSFNKMAAQIGRQIDALHVQSSIDAEILDRLDVAQVMQSVLRRLQALIPQADIGIIEITGTNGEASILHQPGKALRLHGAVGQPGAPDPDVDGWRAWHAGDQRPAWLRQLPLNVMTTLQTQEVRARGELLAWIVMGLPAPARLEDETEREVRELRDRVGVTLTASRRERQLVDRATTDSLTGLLNRAGIAEAVHARVEGDSSHNAQALTLLFVDLDRFKDVNDHLGHQAGDELLCVVSRRLAACAPPNSLLARPGGDEFVLVLPGSPEQAADVAAQICRSLAEPVPLRGQLMAVGASIGLARFPEHGRTLTELLRHADMAMYVAKAGGRGQYHWFDPALDAQQSDRIALLQDLRQALACHQFELHYQPRVSASTLQAGSVEALIRWRHPVRGLVPPDRFIDLLEETGQIETVGQWVLETACDQLRQWRASGMQLACVAVNVSPRQIQASGYADQVLATIARAKLATSDIELEVTEGLFVSKDDTTTAKLQRLRDAGIHIAIDDFGTGYSSLSYLHRLPFDVLKIDRSFVSQLGASTDQTGVTLAIVAMARALKKRVVAEGVETQQQASHLRGIGCHELQGFYFSRPLERDSLAAWVAAQQTAPMLEVEAAG